MAVLVGTSGWQYDEWRGRFYPSELPKRAWLGFFATRFPTVEINNSFYRLPSAEAFGRWRNETPDGFVMAVKASRFITHIRRMCTTSLIRAFTPLEPAHRCAPRAPTCDASGSHPT